LITKVATRDVSTEQHSIEGICMSPRLFTEELLKQQTFEP
jgi:hypothetical protein